MQVEYGLLNAEEEIAKLLFSNGQASVRNLATVPVTDSLYADLRFVFDGTVVADIVLPKELDAIVK